MKEKLKLIAGNKKWIEILFTLLLLSFPFGSFLLSFSIGFMTVYPFLILLLLLSFLSFWMPVEKSIGITKYYLLFLVFFFLYALAFLPFIEGRSHAIVDLRSIALMLMSAWVLISINRLLGFENWRRIILVSFYIILGLITLFALVEINTGWHFEGAFTEKIEARYIQDNLSYVPVFLWDNPNTFIAYYLLIGGGIILLEPEGKRKVYSVSCILIISLLFSTIAEARLGQFAVCVTAVIYFFYYLKMEGIKVLKGAWFYLGFVLFGMTYVILTHPIRTEIPRANQMKVQTLIPVYPVPAAARHIYPDLVKPLEMEAAENAKTAPPNGLVRSSNTERLALIKNGLDFIKESHFLGVGPGQYRYRHENGKIQHYVFGNNGAHFWLIELISQYGILITLGYLILMFWIFLKVVRFYKVQTELAIGILIGLVLLMVTSVLPSAFLILDIHWIFTGILIIAAGEMSVQKTVLVND